VFYIGLLYRIIDYAQESGWAGYRGEAVDLVVLLETSKVERRAIREAGIVDRLVIVAFI
jgi:hypothetical protein